MRIYSTATIPALTLTVEQGHYHIYADDTLLIDSMLVKENCLRMRNYKGRVALTIGQHNYGSFTSLKMVDTDSTGIIAYTPDNAKKRSYEGGLQVSPHSGNGLLLVNNVELEAYLAGVVQSEIYGNLPDIYKVQAVISRTWALRNLNKHAAEGYNLCDHVHCQAYHNRCTKPTIRKAVEATAGQTLQDSLGNLIETPFHSNSGGETANSEDVWSKAYPYLRSINDPYSLGMKQSTWNKTIALEKWLHFFKKEGLVNINDDSIRYQLTHFSQPHRVARLLGVSLPKIRTEFKLKSTFFDVSYDSASNQVTLHGRGYGHGVGLSQEGAIHCAQMGQGYEQILLFYYPTAHLSLKDFSSPTLAVDAKRNTKKTNKAATKKTSTEKPPVKKPPEPEEDSEWQLDW